MKTNSKSRRSYQITTKIILGIICLLWIFPLFYIIVTSFRTDDAVQLEGYMLFPKDLTFDTYIKVLSDTKSTPVLQWFFNSLITSVSSALLIVLIDAMAAYGYSRMKFKGRAALFSGLMFTMMIPGVINLIPTYSIISALGMKNTLWALILPGLGGVGNIFLIRQFFFSIPKDFDEAATIDGAGEIRIFFMSFAADSSGISRCGTLFFFG